MFVLSGCGLKVKPKSVQEIDPYDGGVYVSIDKGETWEQKDKIPTITGKPLSIGALRLMDLIMDPSDSKTIYAGGVVSGLLYTHNQGKEWNIVSSLPVKSVNSIAVDHKDKCNIYITSGNKAFKSEDCTRTWKEIYNDNNAAISINAVVTDHYNSGIVYLTSSRGELIKSIDAGGRWKTIYRTGRREMVDVIISPHDSRILFAADEGGKLYRSKDAGENWEDLSDILKESKIGRYRKLAMSKVSEGLLVYGNGFKIHRSKDYGDTWEEINIIAPDKKSGINDVVISEKDENEIYYLSNNTFYRTLDGGVTWTTRQINTYAFYKEILMDSENDVLYIGMFKEPPPET